VKVMTTVQGVRAEALLALGRDPREPRMVEVLRAAAAETRSVVAARDTRPVARLWQAYAGGLEIAARITEWQGAIRAAEPEARRHLDAARILASDVLETLNVDDLAHAALVAALRQIADLERPETVPHWLRLLRAIPLPVPLSDPPAEAFRGASQPPTNEPKPIAVALFSLDGELAPDATVIEANRFYDLRLDLRLTHWPASTPHLEARTISVAGENANLPTFRFSRPQAPDGDGLWTVSAEGKLVLKAIQPLDADPISFTILVELAGDGVTRRQAVRAVGQRELRLWAATNAKDVYFGQSHQLDHRLAKILALLLKNDALAPEAERRAFMRFLIALLRVTTSMQRRGMYPTAQVSERQFQADLLPLLDQRDELGGRIQVGAELGGGETDLVHDKIVAELKVEKNSAVTEVRAHEYLGQTTSYSSGLGSQLGIAVVLDLSRKQDPLGIPANYVYWLQPRLHGTVDPPYPSHVAVIVVNGNLPRPSRMPGGVAEHAPP